MTDMPEKIWLVRANDGAFDDVGPTRYVDKSTRYTRSDIAWKEALEAAAKLLEKRIENIVRDEGLHDYTTNVTELPEWAEDICDELEMQAAAIRAMKRKPAKIAESEND